MHSYAWLLLALPMLGFIVTGAFGRQMSRAMTALVGCGVVGLAFIVALLAFVQVHGQASASSFNDLIYYTYAQAGTFRLDLGLLIDPLTCVMLLIVTGVGFLIHVYSIGYMEHSPNFSRFFSYLNLFIFSMLVLVLADNYLILLVGWALVGLSSFLLIGFEFERRAAVLAARKAFVMNVIGDAGMMVAAYLLFVHFGTLSYDGVFSKAQFMRPDSGILNAICLTLLIGATAKSAQIPLYTWLPDAMEGPTPVSALIHAATMVTAGVYLIARSHVLFHLAPFSLSVVAIIGGAGALFAATIALTQTDIKRTLAYSTMSQIAYMFLGCGVGAFGSGMFHLMTHAFFKALLFLGAGSIIHALNNEQDMRKMGGLRAKLPRTYTLMLIACLAIAGIPPLAGFFSKDEILGSALARGNWYVILWFVGVLTAGLTAFYMFRLFYLTFHGEYKGPRDVYDHAHEAPLVMFLPLVVLGVLSVAGGWIQVPGGWHGLDAFLDPVFTRYSAAHAAPPPVAANWVAIALTVIVAVIGWYGAYRMYGGAERRPYRGLKALYNLSYHKYYIDEIYNEIFVVSTRGAARVLYSVVDREAIDGLVNGVGGAVRRVSQGVSPVESGYVRTYAFSIFVGVILVALVPVVFSSMVK